MLRSVAAVLGGFIAMAIVVMVGTMAASATLLPGRLSRMQSGAPAGGVSRRYLIANLAVSLLAAAIGGVLAARIAGSHPMVHVVVLAALVLLMSAVSARGNSADQPSWYPRVIAMIGVGGVLIGGLVAGPR